MTFTTAKEGKLLYVRTSIGKKIYYFECKAIEEVENGFVLSDVHNQEQGDDVLISNAPVLITHSSLAGKIYSQSELANS